MERIAFIIDHVYIYWSHIVLVLAVLAAVCLFLGLYAGKGRTAAGLACVVLAVPLSMALSRLFFGYFQPEREGFALAGAFAGCFLAAVVLRLIRLVEDLPELLDCMSLAGCLGIALGRLSSFFNSADRGMLLTGPAEALWVSRVINPVSGAVEYRLATFVLQAVAAAAIFLVLLFFLKAGAGKRGDTALGFALLYGASQVVLDSTRYDCLHFRSNGFVSVVQVLAAAAVGLAVILCAVRLVKAGGWKKGYLLLWLLQSVCFGLAGYMEYYVQRHGGEAVLAYSIMTSALLVLVISVLASGWLSAREEHKMEGLPWRS